MAPLNIDTIFENAYDLEQSSIKLYQLRLNMLKDHFKQPLEYILSHPNEVVKYIKKTYSSIQTRNNFTSSVKALFKYNPQLQKEYGKKYEMWKVHTTAMTQAVSKHYALSKPTEKQMNTYITWEEVSKKLKELQDSQYGSDAHLLLAMYSLEEPKRQDYGNVEIFKKTPPQPIANTENYIIDGKNHMTLVLNKYKTAKKYKKMVRKLVPELANIIKASLEAKPRKHLFVTKDDKPYEKSNSFTQYSNRMFNRLFNKKVTVNTLRHSFIKKFLTSDVADNHAEKLKVSQSMGHSVTMQSIYAFKDNEDIAETTAHVAKKLTLGTNGTV